MPVITVSGNLGSGAREIAYLAAGRLALDFVDHEILTRAAQSLGVSVAAVEQRDERPATLGERLVSLLRNFLERSAIAAGDPALGPEGLGIILSRTYADVMGERHAARGVPAQTGAPMERPAGPPFAEAGPEDLDERRYTDTITGVIKALAESGNVVILGRASPVILRDRPDALHVLAVAPPDLRVQRVALREEISVEEAKRRAHDVDRGRAAFHRKFFKVDADDPSLFDLVIHTKRLSFEAGADLVVLAARALEASPA
jgi:cytidylate kinase